jgi:hypothetical protein
MTEQQKRDRADEIARVLYGLVYDNREHLVGAVGIVSVGHPPDGAPDGGAVHTHLVCDAADAVRLLVGAELLKVRVLGTPGPDAPRTGEDPDGA